MFRFNEQTKYSNNSHRKPATCDNNNNRQGPPRLANFIDRLRLKAPSSAFNVKVKQQSQQLCAKLNQLQYGRLKDDFQRSLGRAFVQTSGRKSAHTDGRLESTARKTRSSCGGLIITTTTTSGPAIAGKKAQITPLLQRSFSVNPRSSLVRTTSIATEQQQQQQRQQQQQPTAAVRRNEWATRSLNQTNAVRNVAMRQRSSEQGDESGARKRPAAYAVKQRQRQPLAARLMMWPLVSGTGGHVRDQHRRLQQQQQQQRCAPRKSKPEQQATDCDKSRSQSIVSLLSSAAASRRQNKRPAPAGARLMTMPFMFVAALQLLFVLVSVLGPTQPVSVDCAPISQFVSINPIWLADGLMDVSDSSSLDGDNSQQLLSGPIDGGDERSYEPASLEDDATLARTLLDRMASMHGQQQTELDANEQQVRALDQHLEQQQRQPPKRSWFSLASKQERAQPTAAAAGQIGLPYMKRRANASPQEYLWIERRRLNRDRALEPPAWLRTRPIRRGGDDGGDDANDGAQLLARERAADRQDQMSESPAARPIRRRSSRGRQLRESTSETYDQILRHLLEEALENGSLLAELYDDLGARTRDQQRTNGKMTQLEPLTAGATGQAAPADKGDSKQPEGQEGTLVVAGDEVSSEDDVIPVDAPAVLSAPASALASPALTLSRNDQLISAVQVPTQAQHLDQLAQSSPAAGNLLVLSPSELTSIDAGGGGVGSGGLIELMKQATGPVDQQQEPSFHVIEDIDRVDPSQEVSQPEQQQQQQPDVQFAETSPAGSASQATLFKRSIELDSSVVGDFKEEDKQEEDEKEGEGSHGQEQHDQLPVPSQIQQVVVARRASFGRGHTDQQLSQNTAATQQQPVAVDRSLAATAIRLIRSGYFTRAQLIQFATKLRVFLENRLGLVRGAITGLFPVDKQQLLVELNPERLSQSDQQMLMRTFDYSRKSNSLVLTWPNGAPSQLPADNPLPILSAILGALYDDEPNETTGAGADDDERMQFEEARPTMGVQINELPPVASALVARDSNRARVEAEEADQDRDQDQDQEEEAEAADGQGEEGEQIQSLLMSPVGGAGRIQQARRYVQTQAPQLSEALAPSSSPPPPLPFAMDQQLNWARSMPQSWDEYYQSRRRVALLASYLGALYGLNQQQQQQQPEQLGLPAEFALWQHELVGGPQLGGGVVAAGPPNATLGEVGVVSTPAIYRRLLAVLGLSSLAANSLTSRSSPKLNAGDQDKPPPTHLWSHHLLAIVLALAVTFVIVKLILKRLDTTKRDGKRRRLSTMTGSSSTSTFCERARLWSLSGKWWPSSGGRQGSCESADVTAQHHETADTIKGETLASGDKQHPLGRAFAGLAHTKQNRHRSSADSGLETIDGTEAGVAAAAGSSEKIRRSFEQLTHRLTRLLSIMRTDEQQLQRCENAELASALERAGLEGPKGVAAAAAPSESPQQFRSSTSYIRSLIEALTKAASAQMAGTGQTSALNDDDEDDDEEDEDKLAALGSGPAAKQSQPEQVFQPEDDTEILMAQMDISAAHLILDYMEKHLVDKERLRREWLELNGAACTTPPSNNGGRGAALPGPGTNVTTSKANQLVLQRLAKIALNEDNYHKNRNPNVVPFDRNRVRLGAGKRASGANGCEPPSAPAPSSSKQKLRNQRNARNGFKNSAGLDYINASFIYDDDPRRATHIIAQGPKEQTCGQFWQMVWEQEISVIVMLTRLNENSAQMCHCYWPTQIGPTQVGETADSGKPELSPPPSLGNSNGVRRGSVTSVFSGLAGTKHPNSSAIVAGALNDTALYFELALSSTTTTSRSGSRQTSRSSAEDDLDESAPGTPTTTTSADKKSRAGATGKTLKLEVRLISEHVSSSDYLVRNMYLINRATGETRTISQFHYLAWQEGKTPESVRSFLQFRRKVHKSYRNLASPILVHCSDGAGRSGTYALIDIILERIRNGAKEIDLRATLEHLRDQRIGLCENQAQFEFVLVALAEEIQIILNALPQ